jgi:hypothetical protein
VCSKSSSTVSPNTRKSPKAQKQDRGGDGLPHHRHVHRHGHHGLPHAGHRAPFEKIFEDMLGRKTNCPASPSWSSASAAGWVTTSGTSSSSELSSSSGWKLFSAKGGRRTIDRMKLKMPLFGDVQRKTAISRFTRTLGTLVTSGVPILQALNITRETAGNVVVSDAITKVHDAVKEGESMVGPLEGQASSRPW